MSDKPWGRAFHDLLDRIVDIRSETEADAFLAEAKAIYGLANVSYLGVNMPSATYGRHYVKCTYSDAWVRHYLAEDLVNIDPVVRLGLTSAVPLDWADMRMGPDGVRRVFRESEDFGNARHGLTFPVRGAHGETAIFSINVDASDKDWAALKRAMLPDFYVLAQYFHNQVLKIGGVKRHPAHDLTERELECLKWAAAGKTTWDTSVILGMSERAVKFCLDGARHKLNCTTKTQAVAKAVALGIVSVS